MVAFSGVTRRNRVCFCVYNVRKLKCCRVGNVSNCCSRHRSLNVRIMLLVRANNCVLSCLLQMEMEMEVAVCAVCNIG